MKRAVLPCLCLLWSGCAVLTSAVDAVARGNVASSSPSASPGQPVGSAQPARPAPVVGSLRGDVIASCDPAVQNGQHNACIIAAVVPLPDGGALAAGSFHGSVRVGKFVLGTSARQGALLFRVAVDGTVLWARGRGAQDNNRVTHAALLGDGRVAVAGLAGAGFHSSLAPGTPVRGFPMSLFGTERPIVGVLTLDGEWSWLRDWSAPLLDLRAEDDGSFTVLDALAVSRLGADAATLSTTTQPPLPPNTFSAGARLGPGSCAWELVNHPRPEGPNGFVRISCGVQSRQWPLTALWTQPPLLATDARGADLYVAAVRYSAPPGPESDQELTLWKVSAEDGVRFRTALWTLAKPGVEEDTAQAMALTVGADGVDVMLRYWKQTDFAGVTFPQSHVAMSDGRRLAGVLSRSASKDGTSLGWYFPAVEDPIHYPLAAGPVSSASAPHGTWWAGLSRGPSEGQYRTALMRLRSR